MASLDMEAFQFNLANPTEAVDELGLWQPAPPLNRSEAESFALLSTTGQVDTAPSPADLNHFLARLPANPAQAGQILAARHNRLYNSARRIDQGKLRLEAFTAQGGLPSEISFALPGQPSAPASSPELDLQGWVDAVAPLESFGPLPALPAGWQDTVRAANAFFAKIQLLLTVGDFIESRQEGRRVGLTVVSLSGDFNSIWRTPAARSDLALHQQVLDQAIATRSAWLKLGALVVGGATRLAIMFSTTFFLAIPAAYKFFRQVMEQVQDWPESSHQLRNGSL